MKLCAAFLRGIVNIKEEVIQWLESYPEEDQKVLLEDLQRSGCISGMVGPLVNYVDAVAFYHKYKRKINRVLADKGADFGEPVLETLNGYDREDPLCLEQQNQNLLAWYGFEHVAGQIYLDRYGE